MWWSLLSKVAGCLHKMKSRRVFFIASFTVWRDLMRRIQNSLYIVEDVPLRCFSWLPQINWRFSCRILYQEAISSPWISDGFPSVLHYEYLTSRDTTRVSLCLFLSLSLSLYHSYAFMCFWVKKSLDWRTVPRSRLYVTLVAEIWSSDLFVMETSEISADLLTQFWGEWVLTTRRAAIKHFCHQK